MKVVDMHCDTIAEIYKDHERGGRQSILENRLMLDLRKMQAGDYGLQNFALYVNLEQAKDMLSRAGFALSHSNKEDIVVEYCIRTGTYDIIQINQVLFKLDLQPLGY